MRDSIVNFCTETPVLSLAAMTCGIVQTTYIVFGVNYENVWNVPYLVRLQ